MAVTFSQVKLHDILDLPGRRGASDRFTVVAKRPGRIKLLSHLHKEHTRYLTDNQFDNAGFELVLHEVLFNNDVGEGLLYPIKSHIEGTNGE